MTTSPWTPSFPSGIRGEAASLLLLIFIILSLILDVFLVLLLMIINLLSILLLP